MFERQIYAQERGEKKDCSVRAFSVAACVSYSTAQEIFAKHGRKPNKGTLEYITERVIAEQFPDATLIENPRLTLPKFVKAHNKGHFIVHVNRHALAITDGIIHDWRPRPKTKVQRAWKLV